MVMEFILQCNDANPDSQNISWGAHARQDLWPFAAHDVNYRITIAPRFYFIEF